MNLNKIVTLYIIISFILWSCAPVTNLEKTDGRYESVKPEKIRLVLEYNVPINNATAQINVIISKELFANKVLTHNYNTKYPGKKVAEVVGGLALGGVAAGLFIASGKTAQEDSSTRGLYAVGGILAGIGSLYLLFKGTPNEDWSRDSINSNDTIFTSKTPVKSGLIFLETIHNSKRLSDYTNDAGNISIDIRNYYEDLPDGKALEILFSHSNSRPVSLKIPSSYIKEIKDKETNAASLLTQADNAISKKKYIDASNFYQNILNSYKNTKAATIAKEKLEVYSKAIKDEKINNGRRLLQKVSLSRVPTVLDGAGITESELNTLGSRIDYISTSEASQIIIDGLGMPLERSDAYNEFKQLNNSQKIFALLASAENISKLNGTEKLLVFLRLVRVDEKLGGKLVNIQSNSLIEK